MGAAVGVCGAPLDLWQSLPRIRKTTDSRIRFRRGDRGVDACVGNPVCVVAVPLSGLAGTSEFTWNPVARSPVPLPHGSCPGSPCGLREHPAGNRPIRTLGIRERRRAILNHSKPQARRPIWTAKPFGAACPIWVTSTESSVRVALTCHPLPGSCCGRSSHERPPG